MYENRVRSDANPVFIIGVSTNVKLCLTPCYPIGLICEFCLFGEDLTNKGID